MALEPTNPNLTTFHPIILPAKLTTTKQQINFNQQGNHKQYQLTDCINDPLNQKTRDNKQIQDKKEPIVEDNDSITKELANFRQDLDKNQTNSEAITKSMNNIFSL